MPTTSALKFLATFSGTAGVYLFYDYKTCHPMRRIQYDPKEAVVRLHNTLLRHGVPMALQREMTLSELEHYIGSSSGSSGEHRPMYFAAAGTIYDVSTSAMFQSTYAQWAGKDATVALARMSLDKSDINRTDVWKDLSEREEQSLKSWMDYFDEKYYIKGRLKEYYQEEEKQHKR